MTMFHQVHVGPARSKVPISVEMPPQVEILRVLTIDFWVLVHVPPKTQLSFHAGISNKAMGILNSFVDVSERIATETSKFLGWP